MNWKRILLAISLIAITTLLVSLVHSPWLNNASATAVAQKGIAKIVVLNTFSPGVNFGENLQEFFYYDFEPAGSFINVTEVYYNIIYSGASTYSGSGLATHLLEFADYPNTHAWVTLYLTQSTTGTATGAASSSPYSPPFDFSYIKPGMNKLSIDITQIGHGSLYVYSIELFIEYYYFR